jgi:arsenate reductase-like glutaredoxin family protein
MAIKETFRDRLLTDEEAAGLPNILNLDPDVNVRRGDYQSLSDAYNYYLGGGLDASQADFPIPAVDTTGVQTLDTSGLNQGASGENTGITAAGVPIPVMPPFVETSPNVLSAVDNTGQPISGNIVDPITGDTYAPGDYTDVSGTLADPREKIDTLADTGGRDLPDVRQYADRFFGVDYEALDQEGQAEVDQSYANLYGIDTEIKQPFLDQALDFYQELPTPGGLIVKALRGEDEPKDETVYGGSPVVSGTVFDAEDYGDRSIMDAPDLDESTAPPTLPGGYELPADERELGKKTTALDLAKGNVSMDEFGNFYDAAGNIIDDPRKTETDIALASDLGAQEIYNKKSQDLKNLEIQKQTIQEMPMSDEEKQKMIDQLEPGIKSLKDFLKKQKEKLDKEKVKVQKSSLVDLTAKDDTPTTPDEEFAETGDYDVFSDTPTSGPTVDIADIGAEDEEDYSAPAPITTTPFNPSQGGGGGDPSPPSPRGSQDMSQGQTGMGSCFIAGTKVRMADGTDKNIEDVIVGDTVKGQKGNNKVVALDPTLLGDRKLYSFNNNEHYFFTSEHPFMTEEGWKSIKPEKTKERDGVELYDQLKGELKIGDKLVTDSGVTNITEIKSKEMNDPKMPLYNFHISNDNSYIADDYVVHNKGGGCFLPDTPITMADGTEKPVKDVDIGDKVAEGGKVFAAGRFLVNNLYDYKGIKVSGSHMVNEEGKWTRIEDSKHGKSLGDDEHIVYVFGSENRRILIKDILFTDYFEVKEQEKLSENEEDFFKNWKKFSDEDHKSNVNILNAS